MMQRAFRLGRKYFPMNRFLKESGWNQSSCQGNLGLKLDCLGGSLRQIQPTISWWSIGGVLASSSALLISSCESNHEETSPIPIDLLLHLYQMIDQNMTYLSEQLLQELETEMQQESLQSSTMTSDDRAIQQSIKFERLLERVQDSVFRNNGVTHKQVEATVNKLIRKDLSGITEDGKLSENQAGELQRYIARLGKMRWRCTGSREPLQKNQPKMENVIDLPILLSILSNLFENLNRQMMNICLEIKKESLHEDAKKNAILERYVESSAKVSEEIYKRYRINQEQMQASLAYYETNEQFQQLFQQLLEEQQKLFADLLNVSNSS